MGDFMKIETDWKQHWKDVKRRNEAAKTVTIKVTGTRLRVTCPYTPQWVEEAHLLGGRWRPRTAMWSFQVCQYDAVLEACQRVFGKV